MLDQCPASGPFLLSCVSSSKKGERNQTEARQRGHVIAPESAFPFNTSNAWRLDLKERPAHLIVGVIPGHVV